MGGDNREVRVGNDGNKCRGKWGVTTPFAPTFIKCPPKKCSQVTGDEATGDKWVLALFLHTIKP